MKRGVSSALLRNLKIDIHTGYGFIAILLWSTTVALVRSLAEQIGPLTAAASVYGISSFLCFALLFGKRNWAKNIKQLPRKYIGLGGAFFVLYMLFLFMAVGLAANRHQVLEVGLLNYLWPALTILFSLFFLNKKSNLLLIPGTLLALVGVFLVLTQGITISWTSFIENLGSNPIAYSLGLTAAITWALYSNITRRWAENHDSGALAIFMPATALVFFLILFIRPESKPWSAQAAGEVILLGVITALAYELWDVAMRKGNVVLVAAFSFWTPFFSTILSCIYLKVAAGISLWLGCILIVIGSLLSWASVSDRTVASSPQ
jgi:drug/metabolite transporter (DMT)-like permease